MHEFEAVAFEVVEEQLNELVAVPSTEKLVAVVVARVGVPADGDGEKETEVVAGPEHFVVIAAVAAFAPLCFLTLPVEWEKKIHLV